jgi:hypothetical protein
MVMLLINFVLFFASIYDPSLVVNVWNGWTFQAADGGWQATGLCSVSLGVESKSSHLAWESVEWQQSLYR